MVVESTRTRGAGAATMSADPLEPAARARVRLGVNVDHIATIRQQRDTRYPDPVLAAGAAILGGADQITIHLREDRRHIQDRDLEVMRRVIEVPLNLEMAATTEMVATALRQRPDTVTLVPEKRAERTTEGGLDVAGQRDWLSGVVGELRGAGIAVSMFIDPVAAQLHASQAVGATTVELHTGDYADATSETARSGHLEALRQAAALGAGLGLIVAAGHGLDYHNTRAVAALDHVVELNIGHSIVARALYIGMTDAVREMCRVIAEAR